MAVLACAGCGAPLPSAPGIVRCAHCGMRTDTGAAEPELPEAERSRRSVAAVLRLQEAKTRGAPIEAGLGEAVRELLGPAVAADEIARIVVGIARDFEEEEGLSDVLASPPSAGRLLEGYLKALDEVRREGSAVLKLPFFAVTGEGPIDLERRLDPRTLAELSSRAPAPPKKKKGWWPFGRAQ